MPRYIYICNACNKKEEAQRTVDQRKDVWKCETCNDGYMIHAVAAGSFIISGYNAKNGYSKGD